MAPNILRRSNFIKVLEEAFGNEQWRQCNLFGVKQGGFGTVFAIQFNGTNYCLKVQNEPINERGAQEFQLEANISQSLNIHSTCKLIRSSNPQSKGLAWILYEYIPGCTLYDLINEKHLHSIPNYDLFLMKALISSYKTIIELNTHKTQIVRHRDINPKNIMVNADGVAFIIDFGQSRKSSPTSIMQSERTDLRGTAAYRPSFSYNEGVVLYRTIYDIAGWARTFISVAANEWLETPTRIPYLEPKSPKYYKLLKPFLEIDDNVNLDWQQNLEDIINNASNVLQDPEQLREFQEFARSYDPLNPTFHNKSQQNFEIAKQKNLIFNYFEPVNLGEKMDELAKSSDFHNYIKQIIQIGETDDN